MKNVMRMNVTHNGQSLEKGSVCPEAFVAELSKQGLLETTEDKAIDAEFTVLEDKPKKPSKEKLPK